jgi:cyclopropane-fatty-acyl-phospholipid synthase
VADARFDLAASEATFCFEDTVAFQMQLATRNDIVPLTRGDIAEREERLKAAEPALAPRFSEAAD